MENEPVSMETASLSHQHPIPPAQQGRGGMGARFGPAAGVLPRGGAFRCPASHCCCGSRGGDKKLLPILAYSAIFHPKSSAGGQTQLTAAQPALAPPGNPIIKAQGAAAEIFLVSNFPGALNKELRSDPGSGCPLQPPCATRADPRLRPRPQ